MIWTWGVRERVHVIISRHKILTTTLPKVQSIKVKLRLDQNENFHFVKDC